MIAYSPTIEEPMVTFFYECIINTATQSAKSPNLNVNQFDLMSYTQILTILGVYDLWMQAIEFYAPIDPVTKERKSVRDSHFSLWNRCRRARRMERQSAKSTSS